MTPKSPKYILINALNNIGMVISNGTVSVTTLLLNRYFIKYVIKT